MLDFVQTHARLQTRAAGMDGCRVGRKTARHNRHEDFIFDHQSTCTRAC